MSSAYYGPVALQMDRMLADYSPAELNVIRRFLTETNEVLRHRRRDLG